MRHGARRKNDTFRTPVNGKPALAEDPARFIGPLAACHCAFPPLHFGAPVRTLTRLILGSFLLTLAVAVFVITCVLSVGAIFKLTDLVSGGVPWQPLVSIFLLSLPQSFSFSLPISALVTTLLVFSRMSADSELTAMKACGISLWQIARPPVLFACLLAVVCFVIHGAAVPWSHAASRSIMVKLRNIDPLTLLEEGRFIKITPTLTVYVGKRHGNALETVRIYEQLDSGTVRKIRAASGTVARTSDTTGLQLDLRDVRIDPLSEDFPGEAQCQAWTVTFPIGAQRRYYRMKPVDFTHDQLIDRIQYTESYFPQLTADDIREQRSTFRVELHHRLTLSAVCIPFVLLGIPFGATGHRHESWRGFSLAFACIMLFYLFIILADSMTKHPEVHPHLIMWFPIVAGLLGGAWLIRRTD